VKKKYLILLTVLSLVIAADQATKHFAIAGLKDKPPVEVVKGFFELRYAENPGAAWSFMAQANESFRIPFLIAVTLAAVGFMLYFFHKLGPRATTMMFSLSLIMGGAIGNLIDRVRHKNVVDFIRWYYKQYSWPTFNVADIAIFIGVALLIICTFSGDPEKGFPSRPASGPSQ
jgi:signal peptidase II